MFLSSDHVPAFFVHIADSLQATVPLFHIAAWAELRFKRHDCLSRLQGLPAPEHPPDGYPQPQHAPQNLGGKSEPKLVKLVVKVDPKGGNGHHSTDLGPALEHGSLQRSSTGGLSTGHSADLSDCDLREAKKKRRQKNSQFMSAMHTPRGTPRKDTSAVHHGHRPWHY